MLKQVNKTNHEIESNDKIFIIQYRYSIYNNLIMNILFKWKFREG